MVGFSDPLTNNKFDASLIWTLPENISPTFNKALQFEEVDCNQICDEVDTFSQALINFSESHEFSFVTSGPLQHTLKVTRCKTGRRV